MNKKNIFRKAAFIKVLLAVPLTLAIICAFGFTKTLSPDKMAAAAYMPGFPVLYNGQEGSQQSKMAFKEVKIQPEYNGGHEAMVKFMLDNIKYPEDCKKSGKQGTVYVSFVVDKTGKLEDVKIQKSVHPSLDAEAMRIVKLMPNWKPGVDGSGRAVSASVVLPVNFKLK